MEQKAFYQNMNECTGCRCCQVACKDKNDLEVGFLFRKVTDFEGNAFPDVWSASLSMGCNHCDSPACVANCPQGALYKEEKHGFVLQDHDLCIGCQTCVNSHARTARRCTSRRKTRRASATGASTGWKTACCRPAWAPARRAAWASARRPSVAADRAGAARDLSVLPSAEETGPNFFIPAEGRDGLNGLHGGAPAHFGSVRHAGRKAWGACLAAARKGFRQPPFPPADRAARPGSGRFVRTRTACDIKERSVMGSARRGGSGSAQGGMAALLGAHCCASEPRGEWLGRLAADEVFAELPYAQEREGRRSGAGAGGGDGSPPCDEAALGGRAVGLHGLVRGAGRRRLRRRGSRCAAMQGRGAGVPEGDARGAGGLSGSGGFGWRRLHHEPDDHIAYELEFFAAAVAGQVAAAAAKAGGAAAVPRRRRPPCATSCARHLCAVGASPGPTWSLEHARRPIFYRGVAPCW